MAIEGSLEQIKERVPIVDVIGTRVKLQKSGRNLKGLCPFHGEKSPSFYVFPDRENWHCFGCGLGGDVFSFVMRSENVDFTEALRSLAARAGIELRQRESQRVEHDRHRRLHDTNAAAARFFQSLLFASDGREALRYLEVRGITRATIETFQIGWAPRAWDALASRLGEDGFSAEELVTAGVAIPRDGGGHYDRFRGRVMFPIRDAGGRVIGFGGRILGDEQPKYLNSSDSPVFTKGSALYAIDRARAEIRRQGVAVVVEGYIDALAAHQARIENVVAALGTALTEEHVRTMKRLAPRLVLALDADAAGDAAALRALEVVRATHGQTATPVADRRGIVRLRRDHELDVRIARMPPGKDPDDVIRESPDTFRAIVAEARPIVEVLIDAELARAGDDVEARARAVDVVLDALRGLANPVAVDQYAVHLSKRAAIDIAAIRERLHGARRVNRAHRTAPALESEPTTRDWLTVEEYVLQLIARFPAARAVLRDIDAEDFYREDARAVFAALRDTLLGASFSEDLDEVLSALGEPLGEYAAWIASWGADLEETTDDRVIAEAEAGVCRLRMLNYRREIALIGAFRRGQAIADDPETWARQAARVAELADSVKTLERTGLARYSPHWHAIIHDERRLGPVRTVRRATSVDSVPSEPSVTRAPEAIAATG